MLNVFCLTLTWLLPDGEMCWCGKWGKRSGKRSVSSEFQRIVCKCWSFDPNTWLPHFIPPTLMSPQVLAFPVSGMAQKSHKHMLKCAANYCTEIPELQHFRCWSVRKVKCQAYQTHPLTFSARLTWIQAKQDRFKRHSNELSGPWNK